jgi:hypothetical protein
MTLLELINSEPALAQAVRDGNDGAIQLWLNTPAITVSRKIPISEFVAVLYNCGAFVAIKRAAATGNQTAALAVEILRDSKTLGIEMSILHCQLIKIC